jgi:uncharacterized radical SAM superfamily Fe-S cluster-containing enzyme
VRRLGVTEVRFTGGEPLLRRGLPGLIAAAAALDPRPEISLTTNGIGLARLAGPLAARDDTWRYKAGQRANGPQAAVTAGQGPFSLVVAGERFELA